MLSDVLVDLNRRCARHETPCGDGVVVWRKWGNGPPLLLTHGSHGSWMHWVRNIDVIARKRTVWAVDLPGWGESAMPPEDTHESISKVLADGIRQLISADDRPIDIAGFSLGGILSAYLAGYHPELVRRLILVDTGGLATPMGAIKLRGVRGLSDAERREVNKGNLLALMLHHEASVDELALEIQAAGGVKARANPAPYVLPDKLQLALPGISCPLAAIWGEYDQPHPNPALQEEALRRIHKNLDFRVIPDAGHWAMYERADAFNAVLVDLLDTPLT